MSTFTFSCAAIHSHRPMVVRCCNKPINVNVNLRVKFGPLKIIHEYKYPSSGGANGGAGAPLTTPPTTPPTPPTSGAPAEKKEETSFTSTYLTAFWEKGGENWAEVVAKDLNMLFPYFASVMAVASIELIVKSVISAVETLEIMKKLEATKLTDEKKVSILNTMIIETIFAMIAGYCYPSGVSSIVIELGKKLYHEISQAVKEGDGQDPLLPVIDIDATDEVEEIKVNNRDDIAPEEEPAADEN